MSNRQESEVRTIHPRALRELGEEACIVALGVARDLRSGVISSNEYDQRTLYGSAHCLASHMARRMGRSPFWWYFKRTFRCQALVNLFWSRRPSDPERAARAIEHYLYTGSETPWLA
jgi:hypothetical protein